MADLYDNKQDLKVRQLWMELIYKYNIDICLKAVKDKGYLNTEEKETMFLEVVNDLEGL